MEQHRHLRIVTVLMSWQWPLRVCVCPTHHAIALAAATAHLAAYHNKGAQLIRPQSKGKAYRKKWEEVKRKY